MEARDFRWYGQQVLTLYRQGKYREALEVAKQAWHDCPEHGGDVLWWLACLYSRTGELEKSLEALREALKRGYWWHEQLLLGDPDLEPLYSHAGFQEILAESKSRQRAAQAQARPELVVLTPPNLQLEPPPLLITLHARGGNARDFAPYWEPILAHGWLLAVPQSSQVFSHNGFCWDNREQAQRELAEAFEKIRSTYAFDLNRVVLAGFSQGASLAIVIALQGHPIPCRGCIALVPGFRELETLFSWMSQASERGLRLVLMTGDQDRYYAQAQQFYTEASRRGLRVQLWVEPGLGHEFPSDFATKLLKALDFIMS